MRITKLEHSGFALEKDGQTLLCDPVEFTGRLPAFNNVVGIIITHQHNDHLQPEVVQRILAGNPGAQVLCPADTTHLISPSITVREGDMRQIGGFSVKFFGKEHALIAPDQIPCQNVGFVVDDLVANPGDSFAVPPVTPRVLFVPIAAPWCKVAESVDYVKVVRPGVVIPTHDAVLSELGKTFNNNWLRTAVAPLSVEFVALAPGMGIEV